MVKMSPVKIPPVSIIIPTLNEEKYIPILLESLLAAGETTDIIVVDGNSKDKTVEIVNSYISAFKSPSSLRIISSDRGLSRQRNTGVRAAKHEIILFLDADVVIPSREKYCALISAFTRSSCAAGVAHVFPLERSRRGFLVYWLFDMTQRTFLLFGQPYLGTFCLLTTKRVFHAIRGFDESKPVTEDIDFCFRAATVGQVRQLPVYIPVSERRFMKYGYWHVFWLYLEEGLIFVATGKARVAKITYPFGEY